VRLVLSGLEPERSSDFSLLVQKNLIGLKT